MTEPQKIRGKLGIGPAEPVDVPAKGPSGERIGTAHVTPDGEVTIAVDPAHAADVTRLLQPTLSGISIGPLKGDGLLERTVREATD